jgi:hypothetical protein
MEDRNVVKTIATRFVFIILFCLLQKGAGAQTSEYNTKNAFIVTYVNDTIHGLIKDFGDLENQILFKAVGTSEFKTYTPEEVKAFRFDDGAYYKAVQFQSTRVQKKFLRCLVDGQLSLYKQKDYYYFGKAGADPVKVVNRDTTVDGYASKSRRHIGTLRFLTADCPGIQQTIDKLNYLDEDLINGVVAYNHCVAPEKRSHVSNPKKIKFAVGLKTSVVVSTVRYPDKISTHYGENFEPGLGFLGGIYLNFLYREKFAVQPEFGFVTKKSSFSAGGVSTKISQTYLQVPLSFYYYFPLKAKVHPFISVGELIGVTVSSHSYRETFDSYNQRPYRVPVDVGKAEFGWRVGAGAWLSKRSRLEYAVEKVRLENRVILERIICITHGLFFSYRISPQNMYL